MTKYLLNIEDLVHFLKYKNEPELLEWLNNFIIKGYTSPYAAFHEDTSKCLLIEEIIYQNDDYKFKSRVISCIIKIFKFFPKGELSSKPFAEILEIIGVLNINELYSEVWKYAIDGTFKGIYIEGITNEIDFHTYILKTLFGIFPLKYKEDVLDIIKRDIADTKYMLECFDQLYKIPGHKKDAIIYFPLLIKQYNISKRSVKLSIKNYINAIGHIKFAANIEKMYNPLLANSELSKTLTDILIEEGLICLSDGSLYWYTKNEIQPINTRFRNSNNRNKMIELLSKNELLKLITIDDGYFHDFFKFAA